jgi:hypothetical protein
MNMTCDADKARRYYEKHREVVIERVTVRRRANRIGEGNGHSARGVQAERPRLVAAREATTDTYPRSGHVVGFNVPVVDGDIGAMGRRGSLRRQLL